jgi:hypothetical protein
VPSPSQNGDDDKVIGRYAGRKSAWAVCRWGHLVTHRPVRHHVRCLPHRRMTEVQDIGGTGVMELLAGQSADSDYRRSSSAGLSRTIGQNATSLCDNRKKKSANGCALFIPQSKRRRCLRRHPVQADRRPTGRALVENPCRVTRGNCTPRPIQVHRRHETTVGGHEDRRL